MYQRARFRRAGAFLLAVTLVSCAPREATPLNEMVSLRTEDGLPIAALLRRPAQSNPPGLILVHERGGDSSTWETFLTAAVREGYLCAAPDLRGHGKSPGASDAKPTYRSFTSADWRGALADIAAAKQALLDNGADPRNLAIIGAGLGGILALEYAASDPDMQAVVLISPALDASGLQAEPALERYGKRPILFLSSSGDTYASSSAAQLHERAQGLKEWRDIAGGAHGTDILDTVPTAREQILLWLQPIIAPSKR